MSISIESNGADVVAELGNIGRKATRRLATTIPEAAADLRDEWRANASETAGEHGKHYPKAIRFEMDGLLSAVVFPDPGMPQGGMSFEFGSANQPPHLDGQRAIDRMASIIERRIAAQLVF